uniref:Variant surface glycoprotein 1125.3034 n=1 Tax=Trypanosoma brucei TaxID=5691 RepID=A0A1J0R9F4_9TRYP|nr:variant surface glycoprotein 1125.3034 [Trypanosoma brucei]
MRTKSTPSSRRPFTDLKWDAKEVKKAGGTRQAVCGPSDVAGGANATNSLAMDLHCICGKHSSEASGHKACREDWSCTAVATTDWNPASDASIIITDLQSATYKQQQKDIQSRAKSSDKHFLIRISVARGTNGAKRRMLGTLDTTGADQCTGYQDSTNGPCVQYKAAHLTGADVSIPWFAALKTAHEKWEAATTAIGDIRRLEAQLKALNVTANSLQLETKTPHKKDVTVQAEAETLTSKQKQCQAIEKAVLCK